MPTTSINIKHYDRIDRQITELLFFHAKKLNKEKNITLYLTEKYNTVALIGINLYSVLFLYLLIQFLHFLDCSC